MKYGQFCPIAKAAEVFGERWTLLVLRELFAGATRFGELSRGLGRISPSVLTARLKTLVEHGIVERVEPAAGGPVEYHLTPAGKEILPIIESIGAWGQRWVRSRMTRDELDVELLMLHIERRFDASEFPAEHAVVAFVFDDLHGPMRRWWVLVDAEQTELCTEPPGRKEDVKVTSDVRTLAQVFMGDTALKDALRTGQIEVSGPRALVRALPRWLKPSDLAAVPRPPAVRSREPRAS